MKRVILVALAVFAIAALPAVAKSNATLSVSPAAPSESQLIVLSGCGYEAGVGVTVQLVSPTFAAFAGQVADSAGCISISNFSTSIAGDYRADAWQGKGHQPDAHLAFSVS